MNIGHIQTNPHYKQTKLIILIIIGLLSYFSLYQIAHASYAKTFTISAYYSPLPDQARYVTGSYEGDIRLNGSGVRSADGTPVYPGMIAAPKTYSFGTKMNIPGIGIVAVHDRGGAIVQSGQRGNLYDRLDVWMGYGDEGLSRALAWGKRNVLVTVYGINPDITPNVYLEGFEKAESFVRNIIAKQKIFKQDLGYGVSGDMVGTLQEYLIELGYYKGKVDKYYGDAVYKAVVAFQIDNRIIDSDTEFGAGYFGPQTRAKIEAVIDKRKKEALPSSNLGRDDSGDEVKKLQEALEKLGYDVEINGVYDAKTIEAVLKFQKDNEIVSSKEDIGAGYFGPKTFAKLAEKLASFHEEDSVSVSGQVVKIAYNAFSKDLKPGDSGEEVKKLQQELKKFNLFRTEATGYYGKVTQNAVLKFQQKKGIIEDVDASGAGSFGPQTRVSLNNILGYRENTTRLIAEKTNQFNTDAAKEVLIASHEEPEQPAKQSEKQPSETITKPEIKSLFTAELSIGSTGEEVMLLQENLKQLGFFKGSLTSTYFGEITKDAVIAFQKANGIILSENDPAAGLVGPKTRDLLNSYI